MAKSTTSPLNYKGKDLEHYNALMEAYNTISKQMHTHVGDVLDRSDAEKRGVNTHMADSSSDNAHHEMELKILSEDGDALKLIEDALERLAHGEYGLCQECGKPISEGRLAVRPYAVFCIKCKTKKEQSER